MAKTAELDEFCQALLLSLDSMRKANELPGYLTGKAREVNANHVADVLKEALEKDGCINQFIRSNKKHKICSKEDFRTKEDILREIYEVKAFVDRIKSGNFKLMLDRYIAAHEFAIKLSETVEEILVFEEQELARQQAAAAAAKSANSLT